MYDTCRLEFPVVRPDSENVKFEAGSPISSFAMVSGPNQTRDQTQTLAQVIEEAGWGLDSADAMALRLDGHLVYANFAAEARTADADGETINLPGRTALWAPIGT